MNGLIFNGEGPMMDGTWYNPTTGDSFTVADAFFQDNQYMVKTSDGRLLDYNFIQHYVKSDKPIPKQTQSKPISESLPAEVANLIADDSILSDDLALIQGKPLAPSLGNLYKNEDPEIQIIEKALSKRSTPIVIANIDWLDYPKKEIDMLIDIMEIDKSKIIEWYINKLDLATIKESIKESIINYIDKKVEPIVEDELPILCEESMLTVEEKPKTKKKSKAKSK